MVPRVAAALLSYLSLIRLLDFIHQKQKMTPAHRTLAAEAAPFLSKVPPLPLAAKLLLRLLSAVDLYLFITKGMGIGRGSVRDRSSARLSADVRVCCKSNRHQLHLGTNRGQDRRLERHPEMRLDRRALSESSV